MTRRKTWLAAIVALVLALTANWWLGQQAEPGPGSAAREGIAFDYALSDFNAEFFDEPGIRSMTLSGTRMEHNPISRIAQVTEPRFTITADDGPWSGHARRGMLERESGRFRLFDEVELDKPHPRGTLRVRTNQLDYAQPEAIVRSPGPATLTQAGTELVGGTLTVYLNDEQVELENNVKATYRSAGRASDDRGNRTGSGPGNG